MKSKIQKKKTPKSSKTLESQGSTCLNLTHKQLAFISNYFSNGFNISKAARDAGYKGANEGYDLMGNPRVRGEVDRRMAEFFKAHQITADAILNEIKLVAFNRDINGYNVHAKLQANEMLLKHSKLGAYAEDGSGREADSKARQDALERLREKFGVDPE